MRAFITVALIALGLVVVVIVGSSVVGMLDTGRTALDYAREDAAIAAVQRNAQIGAVVGWGFAILMLAAGAIAVAYAAFWGWAALTRFRMLARPDAAGRLPVRVDDLRIVAPAALAAYHGTQHAAASRQLVPANYSPHISYHRDDADRTLGALATEPAAPVASLPGLTDLATLGHRPTRDSILLGLGPGGERIAVPVQALCHVAVVGATGGGKSNLMRLLLPQLQAIGARVVLADPHFAPIDPESGDDWRPIAARLMMPPAIKPNQIDDLFAYLTEELDRRLELRRLGEKWGPPLFLAMDEIPVIADTVAHAIDRLGRLLREGRKVSILSVGAAQSMLVKVIGGDSSAREAYRTALYVGGDLKSAAAILDMRERDIDEGAVGRGVVYLRSAATSPAQLVRVPLVSNQAIYGLLGANEGSDSAGPTSRPDPGHAQAVGGNVIPFAARPRPGHGPATARTIDVQATASERAKPASDAETARIVAMIAAGRSVKDVASEISGDANPGSRAHKAARATVEAVLAGLAARELGS